MSISEAVRQRVSSFSRECCSYCQMPAQHIYAPMEIDHIIPRAAGGTDEENNLTLSCPRCNNFKGGQTQALDPVSQQMVSLFNPRQQTWTDYFAWSSDGTQVTGLTSCGRATVVALHLNHEELVSFRRKLVSVGWHPPTL